MPAERTAIAVVDLGFGDAGKGLLTDALVRRLGARWVVRFNGGAQAGHHVVTPDGRHHTFAQLGAGSFVDGVRTALSRDVVVHPGALFVEAQALEAQGVPRPLERVSISDRALLITPFHQALNRLRELARGDARHGSCGVGVGEAVQDALAFPQDALRAGDARALPELRRTLAWVRERKRAEAAALVGDGLRGPAAALERETLEREEVSEAWVETVAQLVSAQVVVEDAALGRELSREPTLIFEGAQGVLLDEWVGFHPHTTWSRCTPAAAQELVTQWLPEVRLETVGVLRTHAVRHGPGPLPSELPELSACIACDHNATNAWQGRVRYGAFDAVLARYALAAAPVDWLAITHLDAVARRTSWPCCTAYDPPVVLTPPTVQSLARQEELGRALMAARAQLEWLGGGPDAVVRGLEERIGRRFEIRSRGPRAADVDLGGLEGLSTRG